jgi:hypothetical protein
MNWAAGEGRTGRSEDYASAVVTISRVCSSFGVYSGSAALAVVGSGDVGGGGRGGEHVWTDEKGPGMQFEGEQIQMSRCLLFGWTLPKSPAFLFPWIFITRLFNSWPRVRPAIGLGSFKAGPSPGR